MEGYTLPKKKGISSAASRENASENLKKKQFASMMAEVDDSDSDSDNDTRSSAAAKPSSAMRALASNALDSDSESEDVQFSRAPSSQSQPKRDASGTGSGGTSRRRSSVDDDEGEEEFAKQFSAKSAIQDESQSRMLHVDRARITAHRPCVADEPMIECYVVRDKTGSSLMRPRYLMYIENNGSGEDGTFLLAGQKRLKNKTSNYLIAHDFNPTNRKSKGVLGKLRANWSGSEYHVYDHGLNPEKGVSEEAMRQELGYISFEYDQMGPGKMQVRIPRVTEGGVKSSWRPHTKEDSISAAPDNHRELMCLVNKRPKWDDEACGHVLNFRGRVTLSSVKNFQLQVEGTNDETVLQFGRTAKNRFTLDFKYPLSPLQAFAICLASVDGKLADSRGFEAFQKLTGDKELD